jgi:hypothetical protein
MKIIAFEEHYTLPAIADAHPNSPRKLFDESRGGSGWPPPGIEDLGEGRISAMDAAGIDVQILSRTTRSPTWKPAGNSWSRCLSRRRTRRRSPTPTPSVFFGSNDRIDLPIQAQRASPSH